MNTLRDIGGTTGEMNYVWTKKAVDELEIIVHSPRLGSSSEKEVS